MCQGKAIRNVTLEMSLKPFRNPSEKAVRETLSEMFRQWYPLARYADRVSVLLWTSDGSEILEYTGDLDREFEWAHTIGVANPCYSEPDPNDPENKSIHRHPYPYMENPPRLTYRWLKRFVETVREVGAEITAKPIYVGTTFDPGPEFAKSKFKYEKHNEICLADTIGKNSFVVCYATLKGDKEKYAGFPDGIPDGTLFGTFLGRQTKHFIKDVGFDYLWLSNGFGFGMETWGMYGAVFDGKKFYPEHANEVKEKSLNFWKSLRCELGDIPVETRGTNLTTGRDLACDGVPLREIYRGGFNMEPPPNSPWAALNGDFGLELVGWMSHIAEIPGKTFPFRFYTHDPWFLNSPWIDRYGREPHDIFLPLSVSRVDGEGETRTPTGIHFLTVDDSYGRMPASVPNEVIPHILDSCNTGPDAPGLLTWVYPFDEYHDMAYDGKRISEVFFGDWFMRTAVNNGFPLNTVISTGNFIRAVKQVPYIFKESILVSPVPSNGKVADALLHHVKNGGRVFFYGPTAYADTAILDALNLTNTSPLSGEMKIDVNAQEDMLSQRKCPSKIIHEELSSGGGIGGVLKDGSDQSTRVLATVSKGDETRVAALYRRLPVWKGGAIVWTRGTNSFMLPGEPDAHLPSMRDQNEFFYPELLMRLLLAEFGYDILFHKEDTSRANPMFAISRHKNAFYFAGYSPDTTVSQHFCFPQGAPIFTGTDTQLVNGRATYQMPRAWRRECRVFVDQKDGKVSCAEQCSLMVGISRRLRLSGLKDATVRFFPEPGSEDHTTMLCNPAFPFLHGDFMDLKREKSPNGPCLAAEHINGDVLISW